MFLVFSFVLSYCLDRNPSCAAWAANGECEKENKESLKTLCAHSCRTCELECKDTVADCPEWAKAGECKSNAAFMKKQCPESCKKHDDGSGEHLG